MPTVGAMPNVAIPRSRFKQDFNHSTSWLHGKIIPIDCFEVLPGDDYSVHKAMAEVHMSQPITPLFGNIKMKICAFFIPTRLLWEHTEEFYGANKTGVGPQTTVYTIPQVSIFQDGVDVNSPSHYLGKPYTVSDSSKTNFGKVSVLKERAYWFLVSEWFRNQQVQYPIVINKSDNGIIGTIGGTTINTAFPCKTACKQVDYFTQATLSPQYGGAVSLPLGSYAPVGIVKTNSGSTTLSGVHEIGNVSGTILGQGFNQSYLLKESDGTSTGLKAMADLSQATAAKINDIRYAFQLQKYLERSNYGSRFFEVLAVHYGVTSPDARLQRPEYLGGKSAPIVIRTVLSTAGYDASNIQKVGAPGASSITTIDFSGLFSKGFVEPGYVMIVAFNNHERIYSQGLMREDTKKDRFEFYSPEFANLGDQAVLKKELFLSGSAADENVFGYVGHWDEYRYRKKIVSGLLDPSAPSSLDFWTLADEYTSAPSLDDTWIEEDRNAIARCLVTGTTGPDYIGDFFIEYAATRELPLYNIPGLVDHFGAL